MLAGAVNACKRLFVQQAAQVMTLCHLFHRLHDKLVVIHCNVRSFIDRGKLVLRGRNLIVLRLCCHAELPQLHV